MKGLSFKLEAGRHYAFVGKNGAGKTTIAKLLTGLYTEYEGEILVNGKELCQYPVSAVKAMFSVVYQDFAKYYIEMKDNIALGDVNRMSRKTEATRVTEGKAAISAKTEATRVTERKAAISAKTEATHVTERKAVISVETEVTRVAEGKDAISVEADPPTEEKAARLAGLDEVIGRLENGIDTPLGKILKGGQDLSGGQWQRVAIARSLVSCAPVKILDEPTSALDPVSESNLYHDFERLMEGKTTIFVSHRLGSTKLADEILVIDGGKIIERGTHDTLMAANGQYAEMFEAQREWYQ